MYLSDSESRALVGSSRMRISGSCRNTRASAKRWRSPPDSRTPRTSPDPGLETAGQMLHEPLAEARPEGPFDFIAARFPLEAVHEVVDRSVSLKRSASWVMIRSSAAAWADRTPALVGRRRGCVLRLASRSRGIRSTSVDLPAPDLPTMAVCDRHGMSRSTPLSTSSSVSSA